jgi:general secretion pathway protein L
MRLRIFLPPTAEPAGTLHWILFDARGAVLREDRTPVSTMPRAGEVEALLPAERVLFARLKLPRVNAATIRELLPYAVEDRLLADPAHVHAVPGATNARGETVVAVVDREWLASIARTLAQAGVSPSRAYCESALLVGGRGDWHLVWGPSRGMLVDDEGVSATFDPAEGVPLGLRIALDEAATRGERPQLVRVHTQEGAALPDLERWSAELRVPFERGGDWSDIARTRVPRAALELLQGGFAQDRPSRLRIPRAAAYLAVAILALQAAFTLADDFRLRRERAALEAQREAIFRRAFPEAKVVVDPELQMSRNLADLRRTRGEAGGDEFLVQLTRATREAARPRSVEYANGKLVTR